MTDNATKTDSSIIPAILYCPHCAYRHIDEGQWAGRSHARYLCARCGKTWIMDEPRVVGVGPGHEQAHPLTAGVTHTHRVPVGAFTDIYSGAQRWCTVYNLRHTFSENDVLELQEVLDAEREPTGRVCRRRIAHVMKMEQEPAAPFWILSLDDGRVDEMLADNTRLELARREATRLLRESESELEALRTAAAVALVSSSMTMQTPLGLLPVDSAGMRQVVDELHRARGRIVRLEFKLEKAHHKDKQQGAAMDAVTMQAESRKTAIDGLRQEIKDWESSFNAYNRAMATLRDAYTRVHVLPQGESAHGQDTSKITHWAATFITTSMSTPLVAMGACGVVSAPTNPLAPTGEVPASCEQGGKHVWVGAHGGGLRCVKCKHERVSLQTMFDHGHEHALDRQGPRRFVVFRRGDISATHTADTRNDAHEPQYEGVVFRDGTCAMRWLTPVRSTCVWRCFDDMWRVHGHSAHDDVYASECVWLDGEPSLNMKAGRL